MESIDGRNKEASALPHDISSSPGLWSGGRCVVTMPRLQVPMSTGFVYRVVKSPLGNWAMPST